MRQQRIWSSGRKAGLTLVVVAVMASLGIGSGAVHALPTLGNGSCDANNYCTYQDLNYGGAVFDTTGSISTYSSYWYFNTGFSPNDRTSAVWNRGASVLRVYQNTGYSGNVDCFNSNTATPNVGTYSGSLGDNSASSHLVGGSNC